jgi:3-dehydroquinate synthase
LNFGHTVGHALEAVTRYRRFRHGEAVAYGMLIAADIARTRGTLPDTDHAALAGLIAQMGPLPAVTDLSIAQVLEAVGRDKKVIAGRLHFVLPGTIGTCEVVNDVTPDEIATSLRVLGLQD